MPCPWNLNPSEEPKSLLMQSVSSYTDPITLMLGGSYTGGFWTEEVTATSLGSIGADRYQTKVEVSVFRTPLPRDPERL